MLAVFGAGIASIVSPCVLPLLPVLLASSTDAGKFRPLALVAGLGVTFTLMGIGISGVGSTLGPYVPFMKTIAGALIILFGIVMLADREAFGFIASLSSGLPVNGKGITGGFLLGMSLGILWIPCIGPILGAVLSKVAAEADVGYGIRMLLVYYLGFALPMLAITYSAHFAAGMKKIGKYHGQVRKASGFVLIVAGIWMMI